MKLKIILACLYILVAFPVLAQETSLKWNLPAGVIYEYEVSERGQTKIENADEKLLGEYAGIKETDITNAGRLRIFGGNDQKSNFVMELKEANSLINGLPLEKKNPTIMT